MDGPAEQLNKNQKFLFDLNNFDAPDEDEIIEEEIEVEPPPPTFSEDELEAAKAIAHSSGRTEGIQEEKSRREQSVADLLQTISENFSSLFAAEMYRERQYEEEALKLSLEIVKLLAPSLRDTLGKEALKSALQDVLQKQSAQTEVRIEVHPDMANDLDAVLEAIWPEKDIAPKYKVLADSVLDKGACALSWKDGGMVRNPKKTANDIKIAIQALLGEQVTENADSPLTDDENNAIKNQQTSESAPDRGDADQNGDQHD